MNTIQNKEIETIRPKNITINLSEEDCRRISLRAANYDLTVGELLENFIGDLVDGTYSNGSDERAYAQAWAERCWFGIDTDNPEVKIIRWVGDEYVDLEYLQTVLSQMEHCENVILEDPDYEYIEEYKQDLDAWKEELENYKKSYLEYNPEGDWENDFPKLKNWMEETERFVKE